MPETEVTGTPTGTPAPAAPPAAPPKTTDIRSAAQDASRSIREKQSSLPLQTPAPEPEKPASTPERLLTKEEPQKIELHSIDWSKQSPEIQALKRELDKDYTQKTQAIAEQRKSYDDKLLQIMDRLAPKTTVEEPVVNPADQVRQLREEGRHDEADALVLELAKKAASEEVAGLKQQVKTQELQATFRNVIADVAANSRLVKDHFDETAKIWDAPDPIMSELRKWALETPERMKAAVPQILDYIAAKQYAIKLEKNWTQTVQAGIEAGIKAEKEKAAQVRGSIVPSGGDSRESAKPSTRDVRAAVLAAKEQLQNG